MARAAGEGMDANDATDSERSAITGRSTGALSGVSPGETIAGRFLIREILGFGEPEEAKVVEQLTVMLHKSRK